MDPADEIVIQCETVLDDSVLTSIFQNHGDVYRPQEGQFSTLQEVLNFLEKTCTGCKVSYWNAARTRKISIPLLGFMDDRQISGPVNFVRMTRGKQVFLLFGDRHRSRQNRCEDSSPDLATVVRTLSQWKDGPSVDVFTETSIDIGNARSQRYTASDTVTQLGTDPLLEFILYLKKCIMSTSLSGFPSKEAAEYTELCGDHIRYHGTDARALLNLAYVYDAPSSSFAAIKSSLFAVTSAFYATQELHRLPATDLPELYEMWCVANFLPTSFVSLFTTGTAPDEQFDGPFSKYPELIRKQVLSSDPETVKIVCHTLLDHLLKQSFKLEFRVEHIEKTLKMLRSRDISFIDKMRQLIRLVSKENVDRIGYIIEEILTSSRLTPAALDETGILELVFIATMDDVDFYGRVMDLYTILRMLRTYSKARGVSTASKYFSRRPAEVETAIVYAGKTHIELYKQVLQKVGFRITDEVTEKFVSNEISRCVQLDAPLRHLLIPDAPVDSVQLVVRKGKTSSISRSRSRSGSYRQTYVSK
jgi:hypothetical protein